jgi:hypothetical protein
LRSSRIRGARDRLVAEALVRYVHAEKANAIVRDMSLLRAAR